MTKCNTDALGGSTFSLFPLYSRKRKKVFGGYLGFFQKWDENFCLDGGYELSLHTEVYIKKNKMLFLVVLFWGKCCWTGFQIEQEEEVPWIKSFKNEGLEECSDLVTRSCCLYTGLLIHLELYFDVLRINRLHICFHPLVFCRFWRRNSEQTGRRNPPSMLQRK